MLPSPSLRCRFCLGCCASEGLSSPFFSCIKIQQPKVQPRSERRLEAGASQLPDRYRELEEGVISAFAIRVEQPSPLSAKPARPLIVRQRTVEASLTSFIFEDCECSPAGRLVCCHVASGQRSLAAPQLVGPRSGKERGTAAGSAGLPAGAESRHKSGARPKRVTWLATRPPSPLSSLVSLIPRPIFS